MNDREPKKPKVSAAPADISNVDSQATWDHHADQPGETSAWDANSDGNLGGPPPNIPGYEILGILGRGGMGVVYKARHNKLNRLVAVKMVLGGEHASVSELGRFKSEAEAVARLQHPNIVQVFEVGEVGGRPFYTLEYVDGGSLASSISGRPMAPKAAASRIESLAEAMHLAHSRNVVHRDLKPANILLSTDGTPKVTDFGLARLIDNDSGRTQAGAILGTPSYMAPEQAEGQGHVAGPGVDVYALGAVLYACLVGRPPFRGASKLDTLEQVRSRDPVPPSRIIPQVPKDLETICLKCLRKPPEQRYGSAKELADDLRRFLRGEPVLARPVGPLVRMVKWVRRRPMEAGLIAVVVLVALGGGGGTYYFRLREAQRETDAANDRAQQEIKLAQHAEQLSNEKLKLAQQGEQLSNEKVKEAQDRIAEGLLRAVGFDGEGLTQAELDSFWDLATIPPEHDRVRLMFLEKALDRPETARRLARRADVAAHCVVGLDAGRRDRVLELIRIRLKQPQSSWEARFACIRLGQSLDSPNADHRREMAESALALMKQTPDAASLPALAESAGELVRTVPPNEATRIADATVRSLLPPAASESSEELERLQWDAVSVLAPYLSSREAVTLIQRLIVAMARNKGFELRNAQSAAFRQLVPRVAAEDAVPALNAAADVMLRTTGGESLYQQAEGIRLVLPRVPMGESGRVTGVVVPFLIAAMSRTDDPGAVSYIARAVTLVAPSLTPEGSAAAGREILSVGALRLPATTLRYLAQVSVSATARLPIGEASRISTTLARRLLDAFPDTADPVGLIDLASGLSPLAARLPPAEAERALPLILDAVRRTYDPVVLVELTKAVNAFALRQSPTAAITTARKAAELMTEATDSHSIAALGAATVALLALNPSAEAGPIAATAALRQITTLARSTDYRALTLMEKNLGTLSQYLAAKDALGLNRGTLDSLAANNSTRASLPYLARLTKALARLPRTEVADLAEITITLIQKADDSRSVAALAVALAPLLSASTPERAAAMAGIAVQRASGLAAVAGDRLAYALLAEGVRELIVHLNASDAAAARDTLLAVLDKQMDPLGLPALLSVMEQLVPRLLQKDLVAVAVKMEREYGRSIDYLALQGVARLTGSLILKLPPEDAARLSRKAIDALTRSPDQRVRTLLNSVLFSFRLPPGNYVPAAELLIESMGQTTDSGALEALWLGFNSLVLKTPQPDASRLSMKVVERLLTVLGETSDSAALARLETALRGVSSRLTIQQAELACRKALVALRGKLQGDALPYVVRVVRGLASELAANEIAMVAHKSLEEIAKKGEKQFLSQAWQDSLRATMPLLPITTLVELLKQPACIGTGRQIVLTALAKQLGASPANVEVPSRVEQPLRPALGVWEITNRLREKYREADLLTVPVRPGRQ